VGANGAGARRLIRAAERGGRRNGLSSAHATFFAPDQMPLFEGAGWLVRRDIQFHFANAGYTSFDDFLATDAAGAGVGERVFFVRGREASFPFLPAEPPTDACVIGIVDHWDVEA